VQRRVNPERLGSCAVIKPIRFGVDLCIFYLYKVTLSRQKIQTAVETDKFTKEHQRMAMFDFVCN